MRGRLNLFQKAMLRWRDLHPYNAVHVVRVAEPLDAARLRATIESTLQLLGLTGFELDVEGGRYDYRGGPASVALDVFDAQGDARAVAHGEIGRRLNLAFPRSGPIDPFRFFAIDDGATFLLGLAYDHVIAGGDSIVALMRSLHDRYRDRAAPPPRSLDLFPPNYLRLFRRHLGAIFRGLPGLATMLSSCRHTARPYYREDVPPTNEYASYRIERGDLQRALKVTKAWGVTLNDLLLALLLQAMAPLAEERKTRRRRLLAAASIVNIRSAFQPPATETFGQFLSSFRVTHAMPPGISLPELARDVHVETERTKRRKLWLQTLLGIAGSELAWRYMSPERQATFHAKNYPAWGGVTLVNVDALWREAGEGEPPEYIRGVPTGPMSPLVVAGSTTQGALQLGITWRSAAFTREVVDNLVARMLAGFNSLKS